MALIAEEGMELTDEQLDAVSGGDSAWTKMTDCESLGIEQGD